MADINGSNYNADYVAEPKQRASIGEVGGKVKATFDSWSGAAGSDVVYFGKLQKGARILSINEIGGGTAPVFNVAAGDKLSSDTDLTLTLDVDGAATGSVWVEYLLD